MHRSESMTTKHLLHQFKLAIHNALASKPSVRAVMRARSGKQRFPVAQWVEDLEKLQATSIAKHRKYSKPDQRLSLLSMLSSSTSPSVPSDDRSNQPMPTQPRVMEVTSDHEGLQGQGGDDGPVRASFDVDTAFHEGHESGHDNQGAVNYNGFSSGQSPEPTPGSLGVPDSALLSPRNPDNYFNGRPRRSQASGTTTPLSPGSGLNTPNTVYTPPDTPGYQSYPEDNFQLNQNVLQVPRSSGVNSSAVSLLSVESVVKEKQDFNLQNVSPLFTDSNGDYARQFERKLVNLEGKNSEGTLCIEEFLFRSEKDWFNRYRDAKLGRQSATSSTSSVFWGKLHQSRDNSVLISEREQAYDSNDENESEDGNNRHGAIVNEFLLPKDYAPPSGLKWLLLYRLGDWPLYSIILSFGQIIAANSYQVTLLNGEIGEPAIKLYIVATIYLASSIVWWLVFRALKSVFVLSVPFLVGQLGPLIQHFQFLLTKDQFFFFFFFFLSSMVRRSSLLAVPLSSTIPSDGAGCKMLRRGCTHLHHLVVPSSLHLISAMRVMPPSRRGFTAHALYRARSRSILLFSGSGAAPWPIHRARDRRAQV